MISILLFECFTVIVVIPSYQEFQKKLVEARRIVVVGNGGIATELV